MIDFIKVKDREEAQVKAHDLLKGLVDGQTLLALSGGTSPDYKKMIVEPGDIKPGAICLTDERYGPEFHGGSNELLLKNAGIGEFTDKNSIEYHKVLNGKGFIESAREYETEIADLFKRFSKRVGVMGISSDFHTAGIFPHTLAAESQRLVIGEAVSDHFSERITLTIWAMLKFTAFVVLAFGEEKREVLKVVMDTGLNDILEYPVVFYRKYPIKSYLITDIDL